MRSFILLLTTLCLLTSCESESGFKEYTSLQSFFKQEGVQTQKFTANSSAAIQITTAKGNKIIFQPNSFVTMDNQRVNGMVNFEIKEITEVYEMVLSNMPTISEEGILESGGEFFVGVSQSGNRLKLAENAIMQIQVPYKWRGSKSMYVYNGKLTADNSVIWTKNNNPLNTVTIETGGNSPADSALFRTYMNTDSLNWVNIDKLRIFGPHITYTINPGNTPDANATMIFVHYTGHKSVVPYNEFFSKKLLVGPVTIIGICIKDDKLYSSMVTTDLKHGESSTLNFERTTLEELRNKLRLLYVI